MINQILVFIFLAACVFSFVLGFIVVYHFNKFKLSCDKMNGLILKIIIFGTTFFIVLSFVFLLLIVFNHNNYNYNYNGYL